MSPIVLVSQSAGKVSADSRIANFLQHSIQNSLRVASAFRDLSQWHTVFVPHVCKEIDEILSLLTHSSIETNLHVLCDEFEHEGAILVLTHDSAAGLEFVHKGVG